LLRFSANLSTLFQDLPLRERFGAAAHAGFKAVEIWFPYEMPAEEMAATLRRHRLACVGINSPAGDVSRGDWGLALDPARRGEFLRTVEQAMAYAQAIDCPQVHVMAGNVAPGMGAAEASLLYRDNIARACDIARRHGRGVMVEPLNAIDRPIYFLTRQDQALDLIGALARPNLGLMLDLFHLQRGEGNLVERMRKSLPHARHVQIADVPGRHEPGSGEINFAFVFSELERLGYEGWIGCEYLPLGATVDGLRWMKAFARGDSAGQAGS
jgi:hydroxypyruvate isomerase